MAAGWLTMQAGHACEPPASRSLSLHLAENLGNVAAIRAGVVSCTAHAAEVERQLGEISALRREAAILRERNIGLEAQLQTAKDAKNISASAFTNLSTLSLVSTAGGRLSEEESSLSHSELRSRISALEDRRSFLERSRLNRSFPSTLADTTLPGSPSSWLLERDSLRAQLQQENSSLARLAVRFEAVQAEQTSAGAGSIEAVRSSADLSELLPGSAPALPEAVRELRSGLARIRKQCLEAREALGEAETHLGKATSSRNHFEEDVRLLKSTRAELMRQMASLTEELEALGSNHLLTASDARCQSLQLAESSASWSRALRAEQKRVREDLSQELESVKASKQLQSESSASSETQAAHLKRHLHAAAFRLTDLREAIASRRTQALQARKAGAAQETALGATVAETRASLATAQVERRQAGEVSAAYCETLKAAQETLSSRATLGSASETQLALLLQEMRGRVAVLEEHGRQERRRGDILRSQLAAACEAGRQAQLRGQGRTVAATSAKERKRSPAARARSLGSLARVRGKHATEAAPCIWY
eukprot:TRINITY_DN91728_c0_g1_i1.p1 TRINITY_DN91728_c0_g1~~TRINITY_DN91728_c0_g1_i1.p1  ORF type:complete len:540 (-),score=108.68 TRINITY_DN91728_c0_g1_i1:404-2023(-)